MAKLIDLINTKISAQISAAEMEASSMLVLLYTSFNSLLMKPQRKRGGVKHPLEKEWTSLALRFLVLHLRPQNEYRPWARPVISVASVV